MNFSNLLPLPKLNFKSLDAPRDKDHVYFNFYGLDFNAQHYFGAVDCVGGEENFEIACHIFYPENSQGSVFYIHGLHGHAGLTKHVIQAALDKNFSVFVFDLPGHGLSSGEQGAIGSFKQYVDVFQILINQVSEVMPKPWHVCAQSTGASVMMQFMREEQKKVFTSYVAFSPLVKSYRWTFYQIPFFILRQFISVKKRKFSENSQDKMFLEFVKYKDPLQSKILSVRWLNAMYEHLKSFDDQSKSETVLTVFQGTNDTTVDWKYNLKAIANVFSNVDIHLIEGAGHQLVNENEITREQWVLPLQNIWLKGSVKK